MTFDRPLILQDFHDSRSV